MAKIATLIAALALFLGIGLWNAIRSGPGNSEPADVVQARLAGVQMNIGKWSGQNLAVNEKQMKVAHAEAYFSRSYKENSTGQTVNVMILYGNPGDLGAHDPKVCYGTTGHELAGRYSKRNFAGTVPNEFWAAQFDKPNAGSFEVLWAWGTGKNWQAPDSPRLSFAGEGRIYKIYIQHPLSGSESSGSSSNAGAEETFLSDFLNELNKELIAGKQSVN